MKKTICRVLSIIMFAICIVSFALCVRVYFEPVRGFLDMRDLGYAIFGGAGVISAIIAFITGKIGWKK